MCLAGSQQQCLESPPIFMNALDSWEVPRSPLCGVWPFPHRGLTFDPTWMVPILRPSYGCAVIDYLLHPKKL